MIFIWLFCMLVIVETSEKGQPVGCFKRTPHSQTTNSIRNCFDFCKFYRYSIFYDKTCSCENVIKANEETGEKCSRKCQDDEEFFCGGGDTESFYETGSKLPGSIKNLRVKETTGDKITIEFEPPERNSSFDLTGYEIIAHVTRTFSSDPWTISDKNWKIMNTAQHQFELSELLSASSYLITIKTKNGELDGAEVNLTARTRLKMPYPEPLAPTIVEKSEKSARIQIKRFDNENGPVTKYLIIVSTAENDFVKSDFNTELLTSYKDANEDGLHYYITAEIEPFKEDTKIFTIGDGRNYGTYFNAPLKQPKEQLKVMVGILSQLDGEKTVTYSNFSYTEHLIVKQVDTTQDTQGFSVIFLILACILCGVFLLSSIIYYGYLRITRTNLHPRHERHEMSLQGPILELDNNGFISCESDNNGVNFRDKLFGILSDLEPHQKISRKSLSLDIDDIMGIGNFGDVIKGQMNENASAAQVHVVSDDIDRDFQMKLLHDLKQVISTDHPNLLSFHGVCQTHDWFFIVFEDIPQTLKQFLISQRNDRQRPNLAESVALQFMFELAGGLEYLKCNKIVHKNLNSHNIRVKRHNSTYKIVLSLFGPTLFSLSEDGTKQMIDEERWFAPEALRFNKFSHISDIYSCALIFWEISSVGGTVYQTIPTADIFARVKKGIRPEKYEFMSDDLYQLMLNCWELESSQRVHDYTMIMGQIKHFLIVPHHYLNYATVGALPFYLPLLEVKH